MKIKFSLGKSLFLLLLLATSVPISAQIRLALYGGVHSANLIEKNSIPGWDTATGQYYSAKTGFQIGFLAELPIGSKGFFFQPGFVYISKGKKFSKYYDSSAAALSDTLYTNTNLSLAYIEVPLYMTYKIPLSSNHKNSFFVSAGPYFSFFFNGSNDVQSRTLSTNKFYEEKTDLNVGKAVDKYKTFDFGLTAKAGFELGNVMISAYISQGLTNTYTAPYSASFHHQLIGATLGIWLTKANPAPPKPPKDTDLDGVPDIEDACPLVAGSVNWKGCPIPDTDHDGVNDENDSCRTVAGDIRYHGCPIPDSDGDGVNDELDSCKTIAGSAKYHGCPVPDRDNDGVNDEVDHCPDVPGSPDNSGCPITKQVQTLKYLAENVTFKSSSSQLNRSSYRSLNDLVSLMNTQSTLQLTVAGHTDATGSSAANLDLSKRRANAVKAYLVKKGIAGSRIKTIGYGSDSPVAPNTTKAGKSLNRRVEFKLE